MSNCYQNPSTTAYTNDLIILKISLVSNIDFVNYQNHKIIQSDNNHDEVSFSFCRLETCLFYTCIASSWLINFGQNFSSTYMFDHRYLCFLFCFYRFGQPDELTKKMAPFSAQQPQIYLINSTIFILSSLKSSTATNTVSSYPYFCLNYPIQLTKINPYWPFIINIFTKQSSTSTSKALFTSIVFTLFLIHIYHSLNYPTADNRNLNTYYSRQFNNHHSKIEDLHKQQSLINKNFLIEADHLQWSKSIPNKFYRNLTDNNWFNSAKTAIVSYFVG